MKVIWPTLQKKKVIQFKTISYKFCSNGLGFKSCLLGYKLKMSCSHLCSQCFLHFSGSHFPSPYLSFKSLYFKGICVELMGLSSHIIKTLLGFTFHNAGCSSCCCQSLEPSVLQEATLQTRQMSRVKPARKAEKPQETKDTYYGEQYLRLKVWVCPVLKWSCVKSNPPSFHLLYLPAREPVSFAQTTFSTRSPCSPST